MSRAAATLDIDRPVDGSPELSGGAALQVIDFSLPSFRGENRPFALIIAFSFVMTFLLAGITFMSVSLMFKLLSFLASS